MATLTIPEDTFRRVAKRAAEMGLTVEQLLLPIMEQAALSPEPTSDDRRQAFKNLTLLARSHATLYPTDLVLDGSREAMYEERLRRQL